VPDTFADHSEFTYKDFITTTIASFIVHMSATSLAFCQMANTV